MDSAIRELELAVHDDPRNRDLRVKLVRVYTAADPPRLADALASIAEISDTPEFAKDPEFINIAAMVHLAHGDYADALAGNEAARNLAPDNTTLVKNQLDIL